MFGSYKRIIVIILVCKRYVKDTKKDITWVQKGESSLKKDIYIVCLFPFQQKTN